MVGSRWLICAWRINESHQKSANLSKVEHSASLGHSEGPFSSTMNLINPLSPILRPYALVGLLISPKRDHIGFRGLRDDFEGRTQKFGEILARLSFKRTSGGVSKGGQILARLSFKRTSGGVSKGGRQPPLCLA